MKNKVFLFVMALVVSVSFVFSDAATSDAQAQNLDIEEDINGYSQKELEKVFSAIEDIPMEVAEQGPEATKEWLVNYLGEPVFTPQGLTNNNYNNEVISYGVVGCVSAVGLALASNLFAPAKLLKIKQAIKAAGGVKTFVSTMIKTYKYYRGKGYSKSSAMKKGVAKAGRAAGPEVRDALIGFFGVGAVYSSCFE